MVELGLYFQAQHRHDLLRQIERQCRGPFPSLLARRVIGVAASLACTASEFILIAFSPCSARRIFTLAMALVRVRRTCFAMGPQTCGGSGKLGLAKH